MPATGEEGGTQHLFTLLVQSMAAGGFAGVGAILFGWMDRRRVARNEASSEKRSDLQAVSSERNQAMADLRTDLDRERRYRQDLEDDRDRGWELARAWHRLAHTLLHAVRNARHAAEMLAERQNIDAPTWRTSIEIPDDLEDAVPRQPVPPSPSKPQAPAERPSP